MIKRLLALSLFVFWVSLTSCAIQADTSSISRETFDLINEAREKKGIPALTWDEGIEQLAVKHSQYMKDTGDFEHSGSGYAENIYEFSIKLYGIVPLPASIYNGRMVYDGWERSPPHYGNMMNPRWRYAAVGIAGKYATFMAR